MTPGKTINRICNHKFKLHSLAKYLFCLLGILSYSALQAQFNENDFEKISIEIEGEEVFDVFIITQDHLGYLWMVTNFGLIRYNGFEGKKYHHKRNDSPSISNDDIRSLFVDDLGGIWIGAKSGLSKYNPDCDCLHHFPLNIEDQSLTSIQAIAEDHNNNIWIGTQYGGLFRYDRENDSISRFLSETSDQIVPDISGVYQLLVDQKNNLWIGAKGLIRFNIDSGKIKQFLHDPSNPNSIIDNRISALYEDEQGQILIGTYKSGFHIYNPEIELLKRIRFDATNPNQIHAPFSEENVFGDDPRVNLIHQDQKGNHWIGTTGKGLNYFNARSNDFTHFHFNLVNPQVLWSIYEDRQGNLWVGGGMGSGLFRTDLYARQYHLNTHFINVEAAYETSFNPGVIWVKSLQQGLGKMNVKTQEITKYVHEKDNHRSIGHNWVRSAYQENSNTLWLGLGYGGAKGIGRGDGGIDRMDIESETFEHFKLTRNDDGKDGFSYTPYSICEDSEGYLWVSGGTGGLFRSDKEKKAFQHFKLSKDSDSPEDVILNIVRKDSNGDIWAADFKNEGTLFLYDRNENTFNPYLNGFKVYDILIDKKGWYLIGTWEKGLIHLNPADTTYVQYSIQDGLPSNDAVDIAEGHDGVIWVGTRMGPAKFDSQTGKISSAGLPKIRYNTGIFKASDNQIYVGANGLISFYPDQIEGNPYPPQLAISEFIISNKNDLSGKNISDKLSLTHDQNDIAFKYVGLHFSDPEKNLYQYKLNPIDDQWINAGNERSVRFANLSPGTYDFQVTASNSDGVWSDEIASVQFLIMPPWWATWWAFAVYISLFAFLANRIYRFQLSKKMAASESKRLKEVNEFKNTLFTNITHEFRTPLTVIKGMADSIKSNLENKKLDDVENSLEMIDRNSDSLLHLVNEMLDLAKIERGNMELQLAQADVIPFIKYVGESFSSFAEENKISLTIYSETDTLLMDFDGDKLTAIISNLLSNAIKFTPEFGKIIVHINQTSKKEKDYLSIKIIDNGIGISKEELPHIFNRFYQADASAMRKSGGTGIGLALTKELVALMYGTIEAKSTIGKGSTFSIMIPVSRNAPISKSIQPGKVSYPPVTKEPIPVEQFPNQNSDLPLLLIIEDNMDVAHYLKTCLANKYETMHAINGIAGIEMALETIPDIIISDVMMPGKDGFEVCETLKSDERTDHIPIILLTAKVTVEDRIAGLSHGADAYLAKPFNKEELFTRLEQLVSSRKKLISKIQKEGFTSLLKKRTERPQIAIPAKG